MYGFISSLSFHLHNLFFAAGISPGDPCQMSKTKFFIIPPWWEYLSGQRDPLLQCSPAFHFPTDIWAVGLAVLDMLIRLAGFVAVVSIIIAGLQYVTATGNAEKATAARRRIINSLIGLAIASVAAATVAFIGNYFK